MLRNRCGRLKAACSITSPTSSYPSAAENKPPRIEPGRLFKNLIAQTAAVADLAARPQTVKISSTVKTGPKERLNTLRVE